MIGSWRWSKHLSSCATSCVAIVPSIAYPTEERTISFHYQQHQAGVADAILQVTNLDQDVAVKVIGERFKRNVQLVRRSTGDAMGPVIELKAHRITALALSSDGETIATAIGNFSNDWGEVRVWNGTTGKPIAKYLANDSLGLANLGEVFRIMFSDQGKRLTVIAAPAGGR